MVVGGAHCLSEREQIMDLCLLPLSLLPRQAGQQTAIRASAVRFHRPRLWKRFSHAVGTGGGGGCLPLSVCWQTSLSDKILHIVYTRRAACLPSDLIVPARREEEDGRQLHSSLGKHLLTHPGQI